MLEYPTCFFSGLTINKEEEMGVILLQRNITWRDLQEDNSYDKAAVFSATEYYTPFCAPFYGQQNWDETFTLTKVNDVSKMLEKVFERNITEIMQMLGTGRELTSIFNPIYAAYSSVKVEEIRAKNDFYGEVTDFSEEDLKRANKLNNLTAVFYLKSVGDKLFEHTLANLYKPSLTRIQSKCEKFVEETLAYDYKNCDLPLYMKQEMDRLSENMGISKDADFAPIYQEFCNAKDLELLILFNELLHNLNKFYYPAAISDGADNEDISELLSQSTLEIIEQRRKEDLRF